MKIRIAVFTVLFAMLLSLTVHGDETLIVENPERHGGITSFEKEDILNSLSEFFIGRDREFLESAYASRMNACEDAGYLLSTWIEYPPQMTVSPDYINLHYYMDNHLWFWFKPGLFGYYDEIDVEVLFPELEIEEVLYGNSYERQEYPDHDWFPEWYSDENYSLECVLVLKTHDAQSLIRGLEYLRSLDYIKYPSLNGADFVEYVGERYVIGDADGDGKVNSRDVIEVMKSVVGKTKLSGAKKTAADLNCDGIINAKDVTILMKKLVNGSTVSGETSPYCSLLGHQYTASYATETVHNVYAVSPHCVKNTYLVISCGREGCDYIEKILTSSKRITTCHG